MTNHDTNFGPLIYPYLIHNIGTTLIYLIDKKNFKFLFANCPTEVDNEIRKKI
jgi:hypothetical protein